MKLVQTGGMQMDERGARVREVRRLLVQVGPLWTRHNERDCDLLRDLLISERVETVVEVGLAYASSALAVGEALITVDPPHPRTSSSIPSKTTRIPTSAGIYCTLRDWTRSPGSYARGPPSRSPNLSPKVSSPTRRSWTAATVSTRSSWTSTSCARSSGRAG